MRMKLPEISVVVPLYNEEDSVAILHRRISDAMQLADEGRLAILYLDDAMLNACGCTNNDTEGLINLPLTAREIQAVVFFRVGPTGEVRVSMRSKGDVDVNAIAKTLGGGGHKNASGCSVTGTFDDLKPLFERKMLEQIEAAGSQTS